MDQQVVAEPLASPDAMIPIPYRVSRRRRETSDTVTLDLLPADESPPLTFRPGQFTMLYLPGVGEIPISVSGDAEDHRRLVHTIRGVGPVSRALASRKAGDTIGVRGPFGSAWPTTRAEGLDVLVIAGGLGLAPVRPILYHLLRHRALYGAVALLYGTRRPEDILFERELREWRSRLDLQVLVTVDQADPSWRGPVGVVTPLVDGASFDPFHSLAFVCGPEIMMRLVSGALIGRGIDPGHIYVSLERNMKCAIGLCGHCQLGPLFICKDGPVVRFDAIRPWLLRREV